jgi:RNA polymerase sigma factor (TIGR02999 family)
VDNLTKMIQAWQQGDADASDAAEELYRELRQRARAKLRGERGTPILSTTDLIHDIYLRLAQQRTAWVNRDQFLAAASRAMRRTLVDHARARRTRKRAGVRIELSDDAASTTPKHVDVLAIDAVLKQLAAHDARPAQLVELRFFGGLTLEEAAEALSVSLPTAKRDWRFARAWMASRLSSNPVLSDDGAPSS